MKAVILDLDGVLIDSIGVYKKILALVLERLGAPPASHQVIAEALKEGGFNWRAVLPPNMRSHEDEIVAKARSINRKVAPPLIQKELRLIPGVERTLEELVRQGLRIGMVTSTLRKDIDAKLTPLKQASVSDLIDVIVAADDVRYPKPAAEPLLLCAEKLGVAPEDCLYVGDMRTDIRAGHAAGMCAIGVLTGFDDYQTLEREQADAIIASVRELPEVLIQIGDCGKKGLN